MKHRTQNIKRTRKSKRPSEQKKTHNIQASERQPKHKINTRKKNKQARIVERKNSVEKKIKETTKYKFNRITQFNITFHSMLFPFDGC